jgi:NADH:ubiquinone oxidoreductase subunit E
MEWRHDMSDSSTVAGREHLLALLQEEQEKTGHISEQFIEQTAKSSGLAVSEVYGVATFYHLLSTRPLGRNVIRVCKCVPCYLKNSQLVLETIQEKLGIAPGETTPDGRFSLLLTNCIGACDQAPAMLLNHDLHGSLSPDKITKILDACP